MLFRSDRVLSNAGTGDILPCREVRADDVSGMGDIWIPHFEWDRRLLYMHLIRCMIIRYFLIRL